MNRGISPAWISAFICFFLYQSVPGTAFSFSTPEQYLAHAKGSASCITEQCHTDFTDQSGKVLHKPVRLGECSQCHKAEAYPGRFGLVADLVTVCFRCHRDMEQEIQSRKFIHAPIVNKDCISCHDPHQSSHPFLLRQSYNEVCISCHNPKRLYTGSFLHQPVKDGNCGLCHDPHASNYQHRLVDAGFNLCITCHDDMMAGMSRKFVHTAILETGCSACHDPHAGRNQYRLKYAGGELCFSCHTIQQTEAEQYKHRHIPAVEGNCRTCHSPHYSGKKNLLIDDIDVLCYRCHKDNMIWKERRFMHGPVAQGNCTACHNPHGSDNAFILRLSFPHNFYAEYMPGEYDLCFLCHKESLVTAETTETVTNFRNGDLNLHRLHVYQKKGRTCRACHDVHASDQEGRIRDNFPFGKMNIQLQYFKTNTGGACIAGCHKERRYDRENRVTSQK